MATTAEPMALNEGMSEGLKLTVSKVIRASRERVFEAWTKPEVMRQWFGPADMNAAEVTADVREGGRYRIVMQRCAPGREGAPDRAVATGVYREVVPNERISYTWNGDWAPGEESLVTVALKDATGGTEVTITHERFLTTESMSGHERGWVGSLTKLAGFLEA